MVEYHVFIRDRLIASGIVPRSWPSQLYYPQNTLFVCPRCGETWARVCMDDNLWHVYTVRCEVHGPGQIYCYPQDWLHVRNMPYNLLVQQFLALTNHLEKDHE